MVVVTVALAVVLVRMEKVVVIVAVVAVLVVLLRTYKVRRLLALQNSDEFPEQILWHCESGSWIGLCVLSSHSAPALDFPTHFFIFQRPPIAFPIPLWIGRLSIGLQTFFSPKSRCWAIGLVDIIRSALVTLSKVAAIRYTTS